MSDSVLLPNGELPASMKGEVIRHLGTLLEDGSIHIGCQNHAGLPSSERKLEGEAEGDGLLCEEMASSVKTLQGIAQSLGAPLIAAGAKELGELDAGSSRKDLVCHLEIGDLGDCFNKKCYDDISLQAVNTAVSALHSGVRALLISYNGVEWYREASSFTSAAFVYILSNILDRNFHLQFRDVKSVQKREKAHQEALLTQGRAVARSRARSVRQETEHQPAVVDPFHPLSPQQVWVKISLNESSSLSAEEMHETAWKWWAQVKAYLPPNPKLCVALELGSSFPSAKIAERWLGERLRCIILPSSIWKRNKAGFPILPAPVKQFLVKTFHLPSVTYLVSMPKKDLPIGMNGGVPGSLLYEKDSPTSGDTISPEETITEMKNRFLFILHCYKAYYKAIDDPERRRLMRALADVPIRPLQPLRDHLTAEIYTVFETDPVKYKLYGKACAKALGDLKKRGKGGEGEKIVAMVLGAGRGPLVTEFIRAADELGLHYKVYALDKNPIAICAMLAKFATDWAQHTHCIHVVSSDMREFQPEVKADIIISELLGSFGCNELSPECLDGAQHLLKPDGISIPCEYSNFLQPMMATAVHEDVATFAPKKHAILNELVLMEMRGFVPIAEYQKAFTFTHPNFESHSNEREVTLTFKSDIAYTLSGFAGYFDLILYKDVSMNVCPDLHTTGLTSWFPAFFPLIQQVEVAAGDVIQLTIARKVRMSERRVYYVWQLQKPVVLPIQNARPDHWISL